MCRCPLAIRALNLCALCEQLRTGMHLLEAYLLLTMLACAHTSLALCNAGQQHALPLWGGTCRDSTGGTAGCWETNSSSHIIDCISSRSRPPDIFLHHCTEMCRDLLPNRLITTAWVPQDLNTVCDALARQARLEGLQLTIAADLQPYAANWKVYLEYLCSLFSRMGGT